MDDALPTKTPSRHVFAHALAHLEQKHPGCPEAVRHELAKRVAQKAWRTRLSLGKAVGIIMSNYVRHRLTDYDTRLITSGSRSDARSAVAAEVRTILASWSRARPLDTGAKPQTDAA